MTTGAKDGSGNMAGCLASHKNHRFSFGTAKRLKKLNRNIFKNVPVECHRVEQHAAGQEGGPVLQPSAQGRVPDDHGAPQGLVHQEQLQVPQGQDPEGGDHQADLQRRGNRFMGIVPFSIQRLHASCLC